MNINEKNIQTNTSSRETGATLYDAITNKLTVRQFLSTAGNESRHSSKRDECSFVFYRLPGESEYIFISQCGDTSEIKSWDIPAETQGVIIAPYEQSGETPMLIVRPDFMAKGQIPSSVPRHQPSAVLTSTGNDEKKQLRSYKESFEKCLDTLREGTLKKVVLSRRLNIKTDHNAALIDLFLLTCQNMPQSYVTLWYTPHTGLWLAATPETLLRSSSSSPPWYTMALAGTCEWKGSLPALDAWSKKNIEEHQYVVDFITKHLTPFAEGSIAKSPCHPTRAGNVVHLHTDISFRPKAALSIGSLLQSLHPTPAVCGTPTESAKRRILTSETTPRKYYAGFSGPININEQTALFVSLRCMEMSEGQATLYAGGGILKESKLEEEWQETCRKLHAMQQLFSGQNE